MATPEYPLGSVQTCAETGKQFVVQSDGCSFNYATTSAGEILSDEGVHIRACRELLDRTRPFTGYLSRDGKQFTGWKGNVLGTVTHETKSRTGFNGSEITHIRVRDVHGAYWFGKGAGRSMVVTLHPMKGTK